MLVARSGYIHLAEALREAWRVFYPDEPDRQMPIREVEEIEAPLVKREKKYAGTTRKFGLDCRQPWPTASWSQWHGAEMGSAMMSRSNTGVFPESRH